MQNLENKPTTRIHTYADGRTRVVPTSKGLSHTEEEKKDKKNAALNSKKKRQDEKKKSIVWNQVKPLYERGMLNKEIEVITSLSYRQIVRSIGQNKYRPTWNKANVVNDNSRRTGAWKLRKENNLPPSDDKKRSIELVKSFLNSGLITKDISVWYELNKLYQLHERPLPENNFEKLRLEVFFTAVSLIKSKSDSALLNKYKELTGNTPNSSEEQFIKNAVCKIHTRDGKSASYNKILPSVNQGLEARKILNVAESSLDKKQIASIACENRKDSDINSVNEKKYKALIQKFWNNNSIPADTSSWHGLHALYEKYQRVLPENNLDKLRLEVFFAAVSLAESNSDPTLLNMYRKLTGGTANSPEEQFIKSIVCKTWRYDGEDEKGLYVFNRYGGKTYQIIGEVDGNPIYETSKLLRRRRLIRAMTQVKTTPTTVSNIAK